MDLTTLQAKVDDLKIKIEQESITPAYLGVIFDELIQSIASTGDSIDGLNEAFTSIQKEVEVIDIATLEGLSLDALAEFTDGSRCPYFYVSAGEGIVISDRIDNMGVGQIFRANTDADNPEYCIVLHTVFTPTSGSFLSDNSSISLTASGTLHSYRCVIGQGLFGRYRTSWVDRSDSFASDIAELRSLIQASQTQVGALAAVMGGASENVQAIAWDNTMHLNTFTDAGVYRITGIRTGYGDSSAFDGFPIENAGATSQIDALLYVLDSSLSTADDGGLACVSQILVLSNRVGRDGHTYTRTARAASKAEIASVLTKGAGHWSDWGKLQTNVEVGVVTNGYRLDNSGNVISTAGLDTLTDNGIYSGVYLPNSAFDTATETFVMVVINNYAVAGDNKTIVQVKFATVMDGSFTFQKRQRTLGSTTWGAWENVGGASDSADSSSSTVVTGQDFNYLCADVYFSDLSNKINALDSTVTDIYGTAKVFNLSSTIDFYVHEIAKVHVHKLSPDGDATKGLEVTMCVGHSATGVTSIHKVKQIWQGKISHDIYTGLLSDEQLLNYCELLALYGNGNTKFVTIHMEGYESNHSGDEYEYHKKEAKFMLAYPSKVSTGIYYITLRITEMVSGSGIETRDSTYCASYTINDTSVEWSKV